MFRQKPCALIKGDTCGRTKPPVDIKTKVAFHYRLFILKRHFCGGLVLPYVLVSPCTCRMTC